MSIGTWVFTKDRAGVSTSGRLGAMLVVMQTWVISSNTSTMLMETSSRSTS